LRLNIKTKSKAVMWGTHVPPYFFSLIPDIIKSTGESFIKSLANDCAKTIKSKIVRQQYQHKPLTKNYLRWKKKKGYDKRILIRTRFFLDNIGAFKEHVRGSFVYRVGVKNLKYNDGKDLNVIARYLEYGTYRSDRKTVLMPARPVFRPMYQMLSATMHTHVLKLAELLNVNFKKKLPAVSFETMINRALRGESSETVAKRRVIIAGMTKRL
jgi:hypothetical protein